MLDYFKSVFYASLDSNSIDTTFIKKFQIYF